MIFRSWTGSPDRETVTSAFSAFFPFVIFWGKKWATHANALGYLLGVHTKEKIDEFNARAKIHFFAGLSETVTATLKCFKRA